MIAEAVMHLQSVDGERQVPLVDFYKGYKVLDMKDNEFYHAYHNTKTHEKYYNQVV